jgi:hypothetical protein
MGLEISRSEKKCSREETSGEEMARKGPTPAVSFHSNRGILCVNCKMVKVLLNNPL